MSAAARSLPDAGEVAERLARNISALAAELLPAGRRCGRFWSCGSVANERGSSLYVHLSGLRVGRWADTATGEFGDALDLVAATQFRGDKRRAYAWALAWLGFGRSAPVAPIERPSPAVRKADAAADIERRRRFAQRVWLEAQPALAGTPAGEYLAARGLDLAQLGRQPRSLRYHPALPHRESGRTFPALVAAISGGSGEHIATHRIWLQGDGAGTWRKAPLERPKMALGSFAGGSIRIWRGASNKPLRDAPAEDDVVIAEGIETALAIAIAVPELRVLAAVSLGNVATVVLPAQVRRVILAADNDAKPEARATFQSAVQRHLDERRRVRVVRSPVGKDFADALEAAALEAAHA